jgi:hypothetical protein
MKNDNAIMWADGTITFETATGEIITTTYGENN